MSTRALICLASIHWWVPRALAFEKHLADTSALVYVYIERGCSVSYGDELELIGFVGFSTDSAKHRPLGETYEAYDNKGKIGLVLRNYDARVSGVG